jgi:hypothetical protein
VGGTSDRSIDERMRCLRRLLEAARDVYAQRARLAADVAHATGLSVPGVELGFASLERDASDEDLRALVAGAGDAARVHVILSANVFVAPLRAIALAWAAAPQVTLRPSSRDPVLARALVNALASSGERAVVLDEDRDVASVTEGAVHVYGRSETIAAVRVRARVAVRAHGPGMGVALVAARDDAAEAAEALAADVVPFDQRGCLSPRVVFVEGDVARAAAFARLVHEQLRAWGARVPRGVLSPEERAEASRWVDAATFAGDCWAGVDHAVALATVGAPLSVPPAGRHLLVAGAPTLDDAFARLAPIAPFMVAVGARDRTALASRAPAHARLLPLGRMQHPPLDGPVDRRADAPPDGRSRPPGRGRSPSDG